MMNERIAFKDTNELTAVASRRVLTDDQPYGIDRYFGIWGYGTRDFSMSHFLELSKYSNAGFEDWEYYYKNTLNLRTCISLKSVAIRISSGDGLTEETAYEMVLKK